MNENPHHGAITDVTVWSRILADTELRVWSHCGEVEGERSLLCPDLYITSPLELEEGAVAAAQQQAPGRDTVSTGAASAEDTLHQSGGAKSTSQAADKNQAQETENCQTHRNYKLS